MGDKAEITNGNQKMRELGAIYKTIRNHSDNDAILEGCFDTIVTLNAEGSQTYRVGEDYYDLSDETAFFLSELEKDNPKLKKYTDKCLKSITRSQYPYDTAQEDFYGTVEQQNKQIEAAWEKHFQNEQRKRLNEESTLQGEIFDYKKSRAGRRKTTLDKVVDAKLATQKASKAER